MGINKNQLLDPYGRAISYLRVSVTDRCNYRCLYCMSENMTFLPKSNLLTLEELERMCVAFISRGVDKIRLTGGEPLVRRNIMTLIKSLGSSRPICKRTRCSFFSNLKYLLFPNSTGSV